MSRSSKQPAFTLRATAGQASRILRSSHAQLLRHSRRDSDSGSASAGVVPPGPPGFRLLVRRPIEPAGAVGIRRELAVALEEPAQRAGNGEDEVAVRDGGEDIALELGEERGALGLAAEARRGSSLSADADPKRTSEHRHTRW